ncbi:LPS export ABC transporter permease LptG [candidate division KSB1 bacterium 4484_87]|nr:MAG: LPS export ABC transporter permease LptG [candidate division KSB1 bacterium 4484_87]
MKILDRYLLTKFLGTLAFSLLSFSVIFIIIDIIGFLDKFIDHHVPLKIIAIYYLYYLPYIIILTLPVAMLLASLFSVGQLARFNEVTAMRSSGMSSFQILMPLFIAAILISVLSMYAGERFVPYTNQKKKDVYQNYVNKRKKAVKRKTKNIHMLLEKNRWLNVGYFDTEANCAFQISIETMDGNALKERIDAPQMVWRSGKWILKNVHWRSFENGQEKYRQLDSLVVSDISFEPADIAKVQKKAEEMSFWELKEFISEIRRTGGNPDRWLVELYLKIAFPFANLIIVLFGAPLASRKTRSGTAISFGVSLFICFLYFGLIKVGQSLGHNGALPPMLAAWLGNIFFGVGAVYILAKSN